MAAQNKNLSEVENLERIRVGTGIIRNLSTTFYPNPNMIFDELVTNARDAMARNVKLHIGEDIITIEDDGEGMSRDELVRFFFISHSQKPFEPQKKRGSISREIIGRFGIGKLSLYQICRTFEILTWKNGVESQAIFNFEDFESKEFVDDFELKVTSVVSSSHSSGTRIILSNLKQKLSALLIKRHLMRTIPLTRDFKVIISGVGLKSPVELRSEDVLQGNVSHLFTIDDFVPKIGKIEGTIAFKKHSRESDKGNWGVFVRVYGRLVNLDKAQSIISFANLTHARMFDRVIYADLNVNGLNEALQTNRAGFIENNPTYIEFSKWIRTKLNKLGDQVYKEWSEDKEKREEQYLKDFFSKISKRKETKAEKSSSKKTSQQKAEPFKEYVKEDKKPSEDEGILIRGNNYSISIEPVGDSYPEAILEKNKKKILINSSHPLFIISRTQGGLWGVQYHALRAAMTLIAIEEAEDLEDFRKIYNKMAHESQEIVSNMKKKVPMNNK